MKYLITTKDGLKEFTEFQETPKLKEFINFNNQKYLVIKIEHFENHIELKVVEYPIKYKPLIVRVNN